MFAFHKKLIPERQLARVSENQSLGKMQMDKHSQKKRNTNKRLPGVLGGEKKTKNDDLVSLPTYTFKICILGAAGVGKTCLVKSFFGNEFVQKHIPTVDDYYVHAISLDGQAYHTTCIIDTSGTYRFPAMQRLAIESSQGFLVLYSLDDVESFHEAIRMLDHIAALKSGCENKIMVNLVATKLDINCSKRQVSAEMALTEINRRTWINGDYIEVSSKSEFRVSYAFHSLLSNMISECQSKEKKKARKLLSRRMRSYKLVKRKKLKTVKC